MTTPSPGYTAQMQHKKFWTNYGPARHTTGTTIFQNLGGGSHTRTPPPLCGGRQLHNTTSQDPALHCQHPSISPGRISATFIHDTFSQEQPNPPPLAVLEAFVNDGLIFDFPETGLSRHHLRPFRVNMRVKMGARCPKASFLCPLITFKKIIFHLPIVHPIYYYFSATPYMG